MARRVSQQEQRRANFLGVRIDFIAKNEKGKIAHYVALKENITERKKAGEEAVVETLRRFAAKAA